MKLFSGRHYFLASMAAITLAACATPEGQVGADGTKIASVKCNRVADAPLGSLTRKDCGPTAATKETDKAQFMNALQTPGSIPGPR